jgi:hypothetical protein
MPGPFPTIVIARIIHQRDLNPLLQLLTALGFEGIIEGPTIGVRVPIRGYSVNLTAFILHESIPFIHGFHGTGCNAESPDVGIGIKLVAGS